MFVPSNNGICTKAPIDEAGNDPDGILITETPEFITVSKVEELNTNSCSLWFDGDFITFF